MFSASANDLSIEKRAQFIDETLILTSVIVLSKNLLYGLSIFLRGASILNDCSALFGIVNIYS